MRKDQKFYVHDWNKPEVGLYTQRYTWNRQYPTAMGRFQNAPLGLSTGKSTEYWTTPHTRSGSLYEPYPNGRGEGATWRRYRARGAMQELHEGRGILQERGDAHSWTLGTWKGNIARHENGSTVSGSDGPGWETSEGDSTGRTGAIREILQEPPSAPAGAGTRPPEGQHQGDPTLGDNSDGEDKVSIRPLERQRRVPCIRHEDTVDGRVQRSEDRTTGRLRGGDDEHPLPEEPARQVCDGRSGERGKSSLEPGSDHHHEQRVTGDLVPNGPRRRPRRPEGKDGSVPLPIAKRSRPRKTEKPDTMQASGTGGTTSDHANPN